MLIRSYSATARYLFLLGHVRLNKRGSAARLLDFVGHDRPRFTIGRQ
jgi:hypothetical protein